jgi:hypothetical protein
VSVKVNDKVWRQLQARLKKLGKQDAGVKVGVLDASGEHSGGISMAELAAVHEFGSRVVEQDLVAGREGTKQPNNTTARIPARSFIRATFVKNKDELNKMVAKLAAGIVNDKIGVDKALDLLGLWGAKAIKRYITGTRIPPPLAVATIKRKGSSRPLVDSGQLVGSISWQVVA